MFVRAKLHETALKLVFHDFPGTETTGEEALRAASAILGPRSAEAATALQLISKSYLFMDRDPEAVGSRNSADLIWLLHGHSPPGLEPAQYYANAHSRGDLDPPPRCGRCDHRAIQLLGA